MLHMDLVDLVLRVVILILAMVELDLQYHNVQVR